MRFRPWTVAALGALFAILAPGASAQTGGTPVPGPGDPCPAAYPGDDAEQSAIARWMARGAALRDLPEELPVMAGLAESGLRNLRHPGGSFLGFFGMHRSLNAGAYRGFPRIPSCSCAGSPTRPSPSGTSCSASNGFVTRLPPPAA